MTIFFPTRNDDVKLTFHKDCAYMQENKLNPDKSVKFASLRILQNHVSEIFMGKNNHRVFKTSSRTYDLPIGPAEGDSRGLG